MSFMGNILTRVYTPFRDIEPNVVYPGQVITQSREGVARYYLRKKDRMLIGWVAAEKEYDYNSLTYRKHLKVNKYKMLISITFPYSTAEEMHQIAYMLNYMNSIVTDFDTLEENKTMLIMLAGDVDTAPIVRVKLRNFGEFVPEYLADKYVGYSAFTIEFESYYTYNDMVFTFRTPAITVLPELVDDETGILETADLTPDLEVFE